MVAKAGRKSKAYYAAHYDLEAWAKRRLQAAIDNKELTPANEIKLAKEMHMKSIATTQNVNMDQKLEISQKEKEEIAQITRNNLRQALNQDYTDG